MKNVIFYFSGTGNSLITARNIAEKIDNTEVVPIASSMDKNIQVFDYERVGFAFPIYYSSVPAIVKQFIGKLNFNKSQYIFGVITFGGTYGMALGQLDQCIAERGGVLSAGFPVRMPGNYVDKYGAFPSFLQRMMFKGEKKKVNGISDIVREKKAAQISKGGFLARNSADSVNKILSDFGSMAKNFRTTDKCNGCGTCERVCPTCNIDLVDMKPVWGNKCEHCVACIQWCPAQAIEYAEKTINRKRYRNPEIKVSDMMRK